MEKPLDAIELGLRVMTAINERENPEPADVEQLRRIAPDYAHCPVDVLVCEVVQRATKDLQNGRRAAEGGRVVNGGYR